MVTIAICAVICGADDFVAIADYGRKKRKWLSQFLDLRSGIPSHDRFNAILGAIKPAEFEACLLSWITDLHEITAGQVVAIDGKTLRRSFDAASSKSAIHMVSAWATANHISLGQVVVDEKSNEITAIPKLLKILEISGCLVTIDAMGCQTEIAQAILDAKADYVLAVKEQPADVARRHLLVLSHAAREGLRPQGGVSRHETREKGHGREETRTYFVCDVPRDLPDRQRWPKLTAIGWVISDTVRDGKRCYEMRYYILSKKLSARKFATAVRSHWSIENRLHWQLDVTFQEDQSRLRLWPCRRQLQHPSPHGPEPAEEQPHAQGRCEEQTPRRRLGRLLPGTSPLRTVTYGAIALPHRAPSRWMASIAGSERPIYL